MDWNDHEDPERENDVLTDEQRELMNAVCQQRTALADDLVLCDAGPVN